MSSPVPPLSSLSKSDPDSNISTFVMIILLNICTTLSLPLGPTVTTTQHSSSQIFLNLLNIFHPLIFRVKRLISWLDFPGNNLHPLFFFIYVDAERHRVISSSQLDQIQFPLNKQLRPFFLLVAFNPKEIQFSANWRKLTIYGSHKNFTEI